MGERKFSVVPDGHRPPIVQFIEGPLPFSDSSESTSLFSAPRFLKSIPVWKAPRLCAFVFLIKAACR